MAIDKEKLKDQIAGLTPSELEVVSATSDLVIETRESRAKKVDDLIRGIETLDEISRLVVGVYLNATSEQDKYYVRIGQCGWTEEFRGFSHREKITEVAPGVFWAYNKRYMHDALVQTGEFKSYSDFNDAAESLAYNGRKTGEFGQVTPQALDTVDHLVHWLAARHPDSDAASSVRYYGTKSGRLMHGRLKGYNSWDLLFHDSVLEEYVISECMRGEAENGPHRPIITLVSTGDWDRALALCTSRKQAALNKR